MKKIKYFIGIFLLMLVAFCFLVIASTNNCEPLYLNSYVCGISSNKTVEWDDDNIYTCNINSFRFYTSATWSCGGTWDLCQTYGYINNVSCGNPEYYNGGGTNIYLYWDGLDIDVINSNVTFEVYLGKVGTVCGTLKENNGLGRQDIDCDSDHEYYVNSGDTHNGVYEKIGTAHTSADLSYYFNYTDTSAGANISTIGSSVSETEVILQGYFYNGTEIPADHYLLGFNVSTNPDMSNNFSYFWGTTGIGQYFNGTVGNLTSGLYYFRAFGQNASNTSQFIYGETLSFSLNYTEKSFYLKFYDIKTGKLLHFRGNNVPENQMLLYDYCQMYIISELTPDKMVDNKSLSDGRLKITGVYNEGEGIIFNFVGEFYNFKVRINNVYYSYKPIENVIYPYTGHTYSIYLYPYDWYGGVDYINCGIPHALNTFLCINKNSYDFGETIRGVYKLPTPMWLENNGYNSNVGDYTIRFYNTEDYPFALGRRSKLHEAPRIYIYNIPIAHFDGELHTFELEIKEYNSYGFDEGDFNKHEAVIEPNSLDWFKKNKLVTEVYFYVTGLSFEPEGNITNISPNPCNFGELVTVAFTSNNVGWLEVRQPDNVDIIFSQVFGYSDATHTITFRCNAIGSLPVHLYTKGADYNDVDTEFLQCNATDDNDTFGSYGYGVPYLYIPERQGNYIAGNSTVYINYKTYKNDSLLYIYSPKLEQTFYSTTVSNASKNVLAIKLDSWMQLGTWNVTFECGDIYGNNLTLYTDFNVVNEEGNWVEFTKHTYTTDEPFQVYIKNTYRVSLTFYKNDIPTGESIIFESNAPDYIETIPIEQVKPEVGSWRVEMWRINDRNIVYELAEWECTVIQGEGINSPIEQQFNIVIPLWLKILIGIIGTLLITISPIALLIFINKKSRRTINLPVLLNLGFFYLGLVTMVLFGFLPVAIIFVVLFGTVIGFMALYLTGNINKVTGG